MYVDRLSLACWIYGEVLNRNTVGCTFESNGIERDLMIEILSASILPSCPDSGLIQLIILTRPKPSLRAPVHGPALL